MALILDTTTPTPTPAPEEPHLTDMEAAEAINAENADVFRGQVRHNTYRSMIIAVVGILGYIGIHLRPEAASATAGLGVGIAVTIAVTALLSNLEPTSDYGE